MDKTLFVIGAMLCSTACEKSELATRKLLDDSPLHVTLKETGSTARTEGTHYALYTAEYLTSEESGQVGRTIYFNDVGNKQLGADFVPGLSLDGTDNISYYIDETKPSADISSAISTGAIARAMQTWEDVTCSQLGMYRVPSDPAVTTGFISALLGFGGSFDYVADVVHCGWLPAPFFDLVGEDGSTYILGVTFTIIFTDDLGNPVDTDSNGKIDVAWREIYYNDTFQWRDGAHYDIETIALHEAGHGLSQGHFGKAFGTGNGKIHFSPRAVMNAAYSGIQTEIKKTDNAGHCSNWASWPNN